MTDYIIPPSVQKKLKTYSKREKKALGPFLDLVDKHGFEPLGYYSGGSNDIHWFGCKATRVGAQVAMSKTNSDRSQSVNRRIQNMLQNHDEQLAKINAGTR